LVKIDKPFFMACKLLKSFGKGRGRGQSPLLLTKKKEKIMEKWYEALRIFLIGFSTVFLLLGMLVVSLNVVNAALRHLKVVKK